MFNKIYILILMLNVLEINSQCAGFNFSASVDSSCFNSPNHFSVTITPSNATISNYLYQFGDGTQSILPNPSHTYSQASNQLSNTVYHTIISLTDAIGCTVTKNIDVNVYAIPKAEFSFTSTCINLQPTPFDATNSQGDLVGFEWDFGDGSNNLNTLFPNEIHFFYLAGIHNVSLKAINAKGCNNIITKAVDIYEKPLVQVQSTSVCFNAVTDFTIVPLSNSGVINSLQWDFDNNINTIEATGNTASYTFPNEGFNAYKIIASTDKGCSETYTKPIFVNYIPKPDFISPLVSGCGNICVDFIDKTTNINQPSINASWKWIIGDSVIIKHKNDDYTICFINNSTNKVNKYNVKLIATSDAGCVDSILKLDYINVFPIPVSQFTYEPEFGNTVVPEIWYTNQSIDYTNWEWNFGDFSATEHSTQNPKHYYETLTDKLYETTLIVKNQYGCSDTSKKVIEIEKGYAIYIPNAFSPNNNSDNDFFNPLGIGVSEFEMWIYNRWGQQVFYSDDIKKGWDGKQLGKNESPIEGTYIWIIKTKDVFSNKHNYKGIVTLIK